jgi:hypothetical protein
MKTQRTVPTEMGDETIFTDHCETGEREESTGMMRVFAWGEQRR